MCHVNQRRTRVFESNRPSPVFVVVSPRERPMTALRAARRARRRHRIDVPSRCARAAYISFLSFSTLLIP